MNNLYHNTLFLSNYEVLGEPIFSINRRGVEVITTPIRIISDKPYCCNGKMHIHQHHYIKLNHCISGPQLYKLKVFYYRYICPVCGKIICQQIPFKEKSHNFTKAYALQLSHLLDLGLPISKVAEILHLSRACIRKIDFERLKRNFKNGKPDYQSRYLGVDEFSLHRNHEYATIVVDLETKDVLFVEKGKTEMQLHHFFDLVGNEYMSKVKAISMDMNAQYCAAVKNRYNKIDIVYDHFHIQKNYNDMVITSLRRASQNLLMEQINEAKKNKDYALAEELSHEYKFLKRNRYLLLSSLKTLEAKDLAGKKHNKELNEKYEQKGLKIPSNEVKWCTTYVFKLQKFLTSNEKWKSVIELNEMLKLSYSCTDYNIFRSSFNKWLYIAESLNIPELDTFIRMIRRRYEGVINYAKHRITNGAVEGVNNMIKTLRRASYGFRNNEYFFLKIIESSRRQHGLQS